jgi:hypothetical protein
MESFLKGSLGVIPDTPDEQWAGTTILPFDKWSKKVRLFLQNVFF